MSLCCVFSQYFIKFAKEFCSTVCSELSFAQVYIDFDSFITEIKVMVQ